MAFFKLFPKVGYDLNNTGVLQNVVNIYRSVRPLREFIDDISAYTFYEIKIYKSICEPNITGLPLQPSLL